MSDIIVFENRILNLPLFEVEIEKWNVYTQTHEVEKHCFHADDIESAKRRMRMAFGSTIDILKVEEVDLDE